MYSPAGCRRGFPRQPGPWQAGPPPPPPPQPYGPQEMWDEMPQRRRGRGQWCPPPAPWEPFPCPAVFHVDEEDREWASNDCLPPPSWHNEECDQGPVECFGEGWYSPWLCEPRPFPGPDDFYGNEENRGWAPSDWSPPRHWGSEGCDQRPEPWPCYPGPFPGPADYCGNEEYRGWAPSDWSAPCFGGDRDDGGPQECFGEGWHPETMPPGPNCSPWPEFPNEEQHPPWPPTHQSGKRDGFQDGFRPWGSRGPPRRRRQRLHRGHQKLPTVPRHPCLWPRGYWSPSQSSSCSGMSQPVVKDEPQHFDPPQPPLPIKAGAQSRERQDKDLPAASQEVPKCPRAGSIPQKSAAADPQAGTEAVEPEQAAGAMLVELGAAQKPASSQGPSALKTEPAPPERSSAGTRVEEPCSQSTPAAGAGSHPCSPTAPPEPAEPSQGQQSTIGAASAEVPPGGPTEANVRPEEAPSYPCTKPETSPGTQHPPGSSEVKPAADVLHQLCSRLPNPSPASTDLRSAAVLARKEKIELSYQQFSLSIAVVATMLLQKEPSMEAALGLALRANLRQGRIHHLQELENFINSYDSAAPSH